IRQQRKLIGRAAETRRGDHVDELLALLAQERQRFGLLPQRTDLVLIGQLAVETLAQRPDLQHLGFTHGTSCFGGAGYNNLPGFISPAGSSACLMRAINSSSSGAL